MAIKVLVNGKAPVAVFRELSDELQDKVVKMTRSINKNNSVTIGLHEDAQDYPRREGGKELGKNEITSVVMIGAIHEFGVGKMPSRPWLSLSFKYDKSINDKMMKDAMRVYTKTPEALGAELDKVGKAAAKSMREHVFSNDIGLLENAESTQLRKGGNTPLVDTQHMVRQIDYKVHGGEN